MAVKILSYQASVSLGNNNARIVFQLAGGGASDTGVVPVVNVAAAIAVLQASKDAFLTVDAAGKPQFVTNAPDAPGI